MSKKQRHKGNRGLSSYQKYPARINYISYNRTINTLDKSKNIGEHFKQKWEQEIERNVVEASIMISRAIFHDIIKITDDQASYALMQLTNNRNLNCFEYETYKNLILDALYHERIMPAIITVRAHDYMPPSDIKARVYNIMNTKCMYDTYELNKIPIFKFCNYSGRNYEVYIFKDEKHEHVHVHLKDSSWGEERSLKLKFTNPYTIQYAASIDISKADMYNMLSFIANRDNMQKIIRLWERHFGIATYWISVVGKRVIEYT